MQQVVAHFHQSPLHVFHSLAHYILKLDMAQRLRQPVHALRVVRIHLGDYFQEQLAVLAELGLHFTQVGTQMTHRAAGLVMLERCLCVGHLLVHSLAGCIDLCGNIGGGLSGKHSKLSDLEGHNGKAAACASRPRCLDLGIQGEQVRLLGDGSNGLDQRCQCAHVSGQPPDPLEIALELVGLRLQLHVDRSDNLLVVLDTNLRVLCEFAGAFDRSCNMLSLLTGFPHQRIYLLDDDDDLALGFGQRIADLFMHHVDVRFAVLDVCLDSLARS